MNLFLNDLVFYKDVNSEEFYTKMGVYDYSDGAAHYIEWATDGNLGNDLTINHILELDSTKSVLLYNYRNPVEGYSVSTPENKDIFAILIDNVTGQALSDQVQISSEHGHDHVKNIEATKDGGFTIIYYTNDLTYLENENRFEHFNKSIFKEFDNDLVSSFTGYQVTGK